MDLNELGFFLFMEEQEKKQKKQLEQDEEDDDEDARWEPALSKTTRLLLKVNIQKHP